MDMACNVMGLNSQTKLCLLSMACMLMYMYQKTTSGSHVSVAAVTVRYS
jgi:hypothetical protein